MAKDDAIFLFVDRKNKKVVAKKRGAVLANYDYVGGKRAGTKKLHEVRWEHYPDRVVRSS